MCVEDGSRNKTPRFSSIDTSLAFALERLPAGARVALRGKAMSSLDAVGGITLDEDIGANHTSGSASATSKERAAIGSKTRSKHLEALWFAMMALMRAMRQMAIERFCMRRQSCV